jgi:hypothetical protein
MSRLQEYLEKVYEEGKDCGTGGKKPKTPFKTKIKNDPKLGKKYQTVEISSKDEKKKKDKKKEEADKK